MSRSKPRSEDLRADEDAPINRGAIYRVFKIQADETIPLAGFDTYFDRLDRCGWGPDAKGSFKGEGRIHMRRPKFECRITRIGEDDKAIQIRSVHLRLIPPEDLEIRMLAIDFLGLPIATVDAIKDSGFATYEGENSRLEFTLAGPVTLSAAAKILKRTFPDIELYQPYSSTTWRM